MLTRAANVKLGQIDHGIELLRNAHTNANSADPTVRADVAVNLGIARYSKLLIQTVRAVLGRSGAAALTVCVGLLLCGC